MELLREQDPNDAPRRALSQLGLVSDPSVFHNLNELESRLIKNLDLTTQIIDAALHLSDNVEGILKDIIISKFGTIYWK